MYIGSGKTWFLYARMVFFHVCTHVCFHLISNVQIVRTFKNRILIPTLEKWYNVSYRFVRYIKSDTSDIWRIGAWFLKPGEKVEENHIYDLVKSNSTVIIRKVYRRCNACCKFFWKMENLRRSKMWNFNIKFQT